MHTYARMSDTTKKEQTTEPPKESQWTDGSNPFVNAIYKKLRNKKKKLDKIQQTLNKISKGEIKANEDQHGMIANKDGLLADISELENTVALYKECFPDDAAFAVSGTQK